MADPAADAIRTLAASRLRPALSTRASYNYQPLESDQHFRLLQFKNGEFEIVHADLNAPPEYETISYVWGPPNFDYLLQLASGETIAVTESLYAAIPYLAAILRTGYLWIDQICILQGDVVEKNQQVALMARIYRACERVLIWFGAVEQEIKAVLTILNKFKEADGPTQWSRIEEIMARPGMREGHKAEFLEARRLSSHSWFKRAWVVQEALLPKESIVVGNSCYCSFFDFISLLLFYLFIPADDVPSREEIMIGVVVSFMYEWHFISHSQIGVQFHRVLAKLSPRLEASVQNDLIYALLGLQRGIGIQMVPDYRLSLLDTTIMTTRAIIDHAQSLAVFEILKIEEGSDPGRNAYPSWVRDMRELEVLTNCFIGFNAAKSRKHVARVRPGDVVDKLLLTNGKVVDYVQVLAQPFPVEVEEGTRAEFRASMNAMLDELLLNEPSHVAEWRVFQAALAEGATINLFFMHTNDREVELADAGRNDIRAMWDRFQPQENDREEEWNLKYYVRTPRNRRLIKTTSNRVGLVPRRTKKGDLICILHGSSVPVVLRQNEDGATFELIGRCYLEGVMCGEAVTWEEDEADTFLLK